MQKNRKYNTDEALLSAIARGDVDAINQLSGKTGVKYFATADEALKFIYKCTMATNEQDTDDENPRSLFQPEIKIPPIWLPPGEVAKIKKLIDNINLDKDGT